jgi:hypothetical protein
VIGDDGKRAPRGESPALSARIFALERACADFRDESDLARAVLEANREIAGIRKPSLIVARLLQAMRYPLGFGRAIYATIDRTNGVEARFQIDQGDAIEESTEHLDGREGSALLGVIRGETDGTGYSGELSTCAAGTCFAFSVRPTVRSAPSTSTVIRATRYVRAKPSSFEFSRPSLPSRSRTARC